MAWLTPEDLAEQEATVRRVMTEWRARDRRLIERIDRELGSRGGLSVEASELLKLYRDSLADAIKRYDANLAEPEGDDA